jgi:hypothetical protein
MIATHPVMAAPLGIAHSWSRGHVGPHQQCINRHQMGTFVPSRFGWIRIVRDSGLMATCRVDGDPEVHEPGSCGQRGGAGRLVWEAAASTSALVVPAAEW